MDRHELERRVRRHEIWVAEVDSKRLEQGEPLVLSDCDLSGVDLSGRNLCESRFLRVNLTEACLEQTSLRGAYFEDCRLTRVRLKDAILVNAEFHRVDLRQADLSHTNLLNADFYQSDLSGADLQRASLRLVGLNDVNLQGANLKQADVYHLALGDVILDGCRGIVKNVEHVLLSDEGKYDQVVAQLGCKRDRIYHVEYEDAEGRFLTQIEEETLLEERDTFWEIQIKCRATTNNGEEVTRSEERRDTTWEVQCRLRATTRNGVVEVQSCSLDFALAELRETMGEKAWFRICRQCRFGLYHPFQGQGLSCLKRVPEVADQVARLGKSVPLEVLQYFDKVAVGPLDTCKDFEHRTIHSADEDD